jgi:hypothetical protein
MFLQMVNWIERQTLVVVHQQSVSIPTDVTLTVEWIDLLLCRQLGMS